MEEIFKEIGRRDVVVQWLVFHQFATSSGMSIGTSIFIFFVTKYGLRAYLENNNNNKPVTYGEYIKSFLK